MSRSRVVVGLLRTGVLARRFRRASSCRRFSSSCRRCSSRWACSSARCRSCSISHLALAWSALNFSSCSLRRRKSAALRVSSSSFSRLSCSRTRVTYHTSKQRPTPHNKHTRRIKEPTASWRGALGRAVAERSILAQTLFEPHTRCNLILQFCVAVFLVLRPHIGHGSDSCKSRSG